MNMHVSQEVDLHPGPACAKCTKTAVDLGRSLGTLRDSTQRGAHVCGLPKNASSAMDLQWAEQMLSWAHQEWRNPQVNGGVIVPLLHVNMTGLVARRALANTFLAWVATAYASPVGSQLRTLIEDTDAFSFGMTNRPKDRCNEHVSKWGSEGGAFGAPGQGKPWILLGWAALAGGVVDDKNGPWEMSCEGVLRIAVETHFPNKSVLNDPQDDMIMSHSTPSQGILSVSSWEDGGVEEFRRILGMRREGVDVVKRGSGIVRLVSRVAWNSPGTIVYMALLQKRADVGGGV